MHVSPVNGAQGHIARPTHKGGIGLSQIEVNIYIAYVSKKQGFWCIGTDLHDGITP